MMPRASLDLTASVSGARGAEATRTNATVKEGVWNPPIPDLNAEQGAWAPTSVWGGASGIVNGVRLGSDFWGHADTAQPSTTCQQIYVEGRVIRPQFSIRSELYLEDTPLATYVGDFLASDPPATFRAGEFMSTGVGPVCSPPFHHADMCFVWC